VKSSCVDAELAENHIERSRSLITRGAGLFHGNALSMLYRTRASRQ
jgi:hypothetical protein